MENYKKINLKRLLREIQSLNLNEYDLIINDFEPITAWAAKLRNIPIISLSHQNAVLDENAPRYARYSFERLILQYYAPANVKFGFHFKAYSSAIFTPIIRKELRHKSVTNKGHYTVYLPSYSDKKICKVLSLFQHVKWEVFSKHSQNYQFINNITIQPIHGQDFIKSITSASGVLCGAGFETPAEALFLRKKLLVIPMKNQYEQQCNAISLKEMGVTVLKKFNTKQYHEISNWIKSKKSIGVHYPDNTEDILDAITLPFYNRSILATIV
ncbi:glycosyltransferase family protein [Tenacibaculum sp. SG-28]|uniref:glycosyltransferase family protein n=1 Tax=Tenacibaculum sp. SG-28 TaxID=754426 RepID=UPI0026901FF9